MIEMNKKIAVQTMQALDRRDLDAVRAQIAPGARFYGWAPEPLDADGHREFMADLLAAFPDSEFVVADVIAEGDRVAVRHRMKGTHQVELQGVPATGRQIELGGIVIFRMEAGKIAEAWLNADILGLMQQLGVVSIGV